MFGRELHASKQYLKRRSVPEEPEDLTKHHCITFSLGGPQRKWELLRSRERRLVEVSGTCSAGSGGLTAQLRREHLGIAFTPGFLAKHPAPGAGLVRALPEWKAVPRTSVRGYTRANRPGPNQEIDRIDEGHFEEKMPRWRDNVFDSTGVTTSRPLVLSRAWFAARTTILASRAFARSWVQNLDEILLQSS